MSTAVSSLQIFRLKFARISDLADLATYLARLILLDLIT